MIKLNEDSVCTMNHMYVGVYEWSTGTSMSLAEVNKRAVELRAAGKKLKSKLEAAGIKCGMGSVDVMSGNDTEYFYIAASMKCDATNSKLEEILGFEVNDLWG